MTSGATTHDSVRTVEQIAAVVNSASQRPYVVGISGFGGSGKSTLARSLVTRIPGAVRLRGDDFLDPLRSHVPSDDWDGVDRTRLADEVLSPFRTGHDVRFRRYDWVRRTLGPLESLPHADVLVVDLVGLLHPDTTPLLDLTVWVDVPLDEATARGMARDRDSGSDHDRLWRDVWEPNERAFLRAFTPRDTADMLWLNPTDAASGRPRRL